MSVMPGSFGHAFLSLWLAGAAVTIGGPAAVPAAEAPAYFPGGVADALGSVGCVHTLAGGVDALDLASGRRLWKSDAPSRALIIAGERAFLLEQRSGRLQLAACDARTGRILATWPCDARLPAWASLAEPSGGRTWTTFEVSARRIGDTLVVGYDAQQFVALGIAPRSPGPEVTGVIRLDLASGSVEHHAGERLAPIPFVEPSTDRGLQPLRFHARAASPAIMLGGPPPDVQGVMVAEDARTVFEKPPSGTGVLVRRWRTATGGEETPFVMATVADAIWPTLDRRHVALRRAYEQSKFDLYSLEGGARVATLVHPIDIAVIGRRLLWTTYSRRDEVSLIASDAVTGRALWRRVVWRDAPAGEPIP
jgi:hypothetical protein